MQNECVCGRSHKITLPQIIVENGAITCLPKLINDYAFYGCNGLKELTEMCEYPSKLWD